jgi:hypothetical protein
MTPSSKQFAILAVFAAASLGAATAAIARKPTQEQVVKIETIRRDISAGEKLTFDRSVEITGSIGAGASVLVTNGGLKIQGDVGDNAVIEARGAGTVITFHESGSSASSYTSVVISNGKVTVNGKRINPEATDDDGGFAGIEIKGSVGRHVALKTDASIGVAGDVEAASNLKANSAIDIGGKVADGASLTTGGSITAQNIGDDAEANAGGSIRGQNIGKHTTLLAGGSIVVRDVSVGAKLDAGGSVVAEKIMSGAKVDAGGSIIAGAASLEDLSAGGSVHIRD